MFQKNADTHRLAKRIANTLKTHNLFHNVLLAICYVRYYVHAVICEVYLIELQIAHNFSLDFLLIGGEELAAQLL